MKQQKQGQKQKPRFENTMAATAHLVSPQGPRAKMIFLFWSETSGA